MSEQVNGHAAGPVPARRVEGLAEIRHAGARLAAAASLPGLLAEAFDAFEAIRLLSRAAEAQQPGLLVWFMLAADAAVDAREALTVAPSLPAGSSRLTAVSLSVDETDAEEVAGAVARLAGLLANRLARAADGQAGLPGDRDACLEAADAAQRISQLMGRGGRDGDLP